jgi:adenylate cyclase
VAGELTLSELAAQLREPTQRVAQWRSERLIGRTDDDETFTTADSQRARLVQFLLRRGITLEQIVRANQAEDFLARYLDLLSQAEGERGYSLDEAAQRIGLDTGSAHQLWEACGLGEYDDPLYERDLDALMAVKLAIETGIPEEAVVQLARVYADALTRVTEAEARIGHFYVHERLKAQGLESTRLLDAARNATDALAPYLEPLLLFFHRRGQQRALREDALMHVQEHAGLREAPELPGRMHVAIAFVDLSGFTSLTFSMGDHTAAQVLERFSHVVREVVRRADGRVVKQIGDAFMLAFVEPVGAVECLLEIERRLASEPQFPAVRSAVHWGEALYREGDYVGTSVNVAARLAAEAERHQVLVTAAVRSQAGALADVEFVPLGRRRLRGLTDEFEVFAAVSREHAAAPRIVDPVCGMELSAAGVAARLTLGGKDWAFCSQDCLQKFVAAPDRYAATEPVKES